MAATRNRIYIGSIDDPVFYFDNDSIISANVVQNVALIGQELSIDTFTPVVMDDNTNLIDAYHFRSTDGQEIVDAVGEIYCIDIGEGLDVSPLIMTEHGTPVWYYQENTLIGKFYMKSVERVGRNQYKLNTVSVIGMLDEMEHGGGLFTASTFGAVLQHILAQDLHGSGDPVITYTIDDDVAALPVSGWLPHDTKRNNLYRLIFANGVNIVKNVDTREEYNGCPRFTFLYYTSDYAEPIEAEQIYNEGSVSYDKPYTNVVVMEHTYTPLLTEDPVTLFDNSTGQAAVNTEVWFSGAPIIVSTIVATGLTLISATENSAIVSGNGILTGIPYLHDARAVNKGDPDAPEEKTIKVEDATFVNLINSANLLNRLYAFYCPDNFIHKISNGIVYSDMMADDGRILPGGQRCGKVYRLSDPYGKEEIAFLSSMNVTASSVNKAECEWYANYEPAGQEGLYKHEPIVLDKETYAEDGGNFTWPDGVTPEQCKIVIIGGGTGGSSGWPGENGQDAYTHTEVESTADLSAVWYGAEGGDGGAGGSGGLAGRVKVVTIENPAASYNYTIGTGGEGGAATGFIPDTADELREALENEHPDTEYTAQEIAAMIATEQSLSGWSGNPNPGTAGTASTFGSYSSADQDAYVPLGGVYEPATDRYFALSGNGGIRGGKGGARKVKSGDTFNWITDGEDVTGDDGTVYRGGSTGRMLTDVEGLPEAAGKLKAYGGNGAGAAVGIGRDRVSPQTGLLLHPHINGGSDQETEWYIAEDE